MDWHPLWDSSIAVKVHLATVIPAFFIGGWQIFFSKKGAPGHRFFGYLYLALMTTTAVSALWIREVSPFSHFYGFSWVHLFVPLTFFGVASALYGVWARDIATHRQSMIGLYLGGLLIAGATAFMPDRLMYRVFFGG
jgi:uncharacterized membrane protein